MANVLSGRFASLTLGSTANSTTIAEYSTLVASTTHEFKLDDMVKVTGAPDKYYKCVFAYTAASAAAFDATKFTEVAAPPAIGSLVVKMSGWKIDNKTNTIETPCFGDGGWTTSMAMLQNWSGSADGYLAPSDTTGQVAIFNAKNAGETVVLNFYVDATHKYTGEAFIESANVDANANDVIKLSLSFKGNGALIYA